MIHEVSGDILLSKAEVIAHGIAPMDDFKNGLALALRERWPSLYKDFRHYCHTHSPKAGDAWVWSGVREDGGTVRVVNLLTQDPPASAGQHPGRATTAHVNHALHALKKLVESEKFKSVALPRLATGVGGLDWSDVQPMIAETLGPLDVPVIVYHQYQSGVEADEPLR